MKKISLLLVAIFCLFSCGDKVVQRPVTYHNDDFLKRSQQRGKQLLAEENQWFEAYRKTSKLTFQPTDMGFWISNEGKANDAMAKTGDFVAFEYQIKNLDDSIIYSFEENGVQKIVLGRVDLPRGLHAALQLIDQQEEATVLLPSFLAYGGFGDQKKIEADMPIIMEIKIHEIRKK
ncbi:FKBP-type peptidyl-prolyl cis-trans isomerase [Vaginella massiliensis]|uniref:FKBP-type peptidyl-prolyl cis-trans isomerase n=1 Tax=Vaginella massiliensis TaxID=1816680 RepID=UPI000838EFC0|nr:FKBP-type peptidyl-prolyl cis-trans isomerase [Vaginella massiliensis]